MTAAEAGTASLRRAIPGTYNLRAVAGYPAAGGRQVREGVLYRSDALHALDDAGQAELRELRIRTIVDLRSDDEVERQPNAVEGLGIDSRRVPIFEGAAPSVQAGAAIDLEAINHLMLRHSGPRIAAAVQAVVERAADGGAVLVHCTAGKDRTGIVIALILDAVGVEREAVIADYAASERHLAGEWAEAMLARMSQRAAPDGVDLVGIVTSSPAPLMTRVLAHVDEEHGGARGYLRRHGLRDEDLDVLAAALTEPLAGIR